MNSWATASPTNPNPHVETARLLEEDKRSEEAEAQLVQALTIKPDDARALAALGRLRDQSGDYQQALQNYQRSLQMNPNQTQVAARGRWNEPNRNGALSEIEFVPRSRGTARRG